MAHTMQPINFSIYADNLKLGSHGHDNDVASVINWQSPLTRALSYLDGGVLLAYRRVKLTLVRVKYILCNNRGGPRFSEIVPDIRRSSEKSFFIAVHNFWTACSKFLHPLQNILDGVL